jgi:hypothetical protein
MAESIRAVGTKESNMVKELIRLLKVKLGKENGLQERDCNGMTKIELK